MGDILSGTVSGVKSLVFLSILVGEVWFTFLRFLALNIHSSDVLQVSDEVKVKVLAIDKEELKLSLGMKQLVSDPWDTIDVDLEIGSIVKGKVIRVIDFGAFILLDNDVEGLIHISEVSTKRIKLLADVLEVGDQVNVKIIKVSKHDQKIGLSMKMLIKTMIL